MIPVSSKEYKGVFTHNIIKDRSDNAIVKPIDDTWSIVRSMQVQLESELCCRNYLVHVDRDTEGVSLIHRKDQCVTHLFPVEIPARVSSE